MAATLRDLLSTLQSGKTHYGFGQEPVPPKRTKPPNTNLALFVHAHSRLPEGDELKAFIKARKAADKQI